MFTNYKPAKLYKGPKHWYIFYSYRIPGTTKFKRFKEYLDINRISALSDRAIYGNEIVKFMNRKLAEGFNPFTAVRNNQTGDPSTITSQLGKIYTALIENQTNNTVKTYLTMKNRFLRFLHEDHFEEIFMLQVDVDMATKFKNFMLSKKLARKTVNATLSHLGLFWDTAIEMKMAVANPFRQVVQVKRETRNMQQGEDIYEPLSTIELTTIFNYLKNNGHSDFMRFLAMIYLAWARPVEITRLKVAQIDLEHNYIKFFKGETKNMRGAYVQLVPGLKDLLLQMELHKYPSDHYLFGENYLPSENPIYLKGIGKLWKNIVHHKLEINKAMYALKHTGNIEYLQKNKGKIDLKWQQSQNRHSSAAMTERYNRQLGAYFIDCSNINLGSF